MASVWMRRRPRRNASRCFYCLLILLCCAARHGPRARAQEYIFRPYRQSQGLENLSVDSLAADRQGFLWAATQNGVYRFLGSGFQRFGSGEGGIAEQDTRDVYAAPDGTLWAGSDQHLYRWAGQGFEAISAKPIPVMNDTSLAWEGPGRLIVLTGKELHRLRYDAHGQLVAYEKFFSPETVAKHPALALLGGVAAMPDGTLWMACGTMLCSWQSGVLQEWGSRQGVAADAYRSILQDHQGAVWAVGQKHVVELPLAAHGPGGAFLDRSLPATRGEGVYQRLPIACDPAGRIIVSLSGGIARWDGSRWQTISRPNGLVSTHLTAFLFDQNGSLWLGSSGSGLHHWIGYADWEGWTDRQGLPSSNIWSIGPFAGDLVAVGTEHGPAMVNSRSGAVTLPSRQSWLYGQVTGMVAARGGAGKGRYLVATAAGALVLMEGHPARTTLAADLKQYIYGLLQDSSGRTYAMDGTGVFDVSQLIDAKTWEKTRGAAAVPAVLSPLPEPNALLGRQAWILRGCSSPDGSVWFGSENGVVRRGREGERDSWARPRIDGLPSPIPVLSNLECDQHGGLWAVVGDSAIWHLAYEPAAGGATGQSAREGQLRAVPLMLPKALRMIAIVQLFVDARGWLWICTDNGLLVWNGAAWRQLTQEDGLIWNDINAGNVSSGPDGSIWVGTSGGLSRILHPEQIFATTPPVASMITARLGTRLLPLAGEQQIPWSRQDLSFTFAATNSLNRAGLVFFYRLEGLPSSGWIESRDETAHFQALPPGDYTFQVFAQDRASGVHSATAGFHFQLEPPWWRRPWFYVLCVLVFATGLLLLFRLRTRHLLGQQHRLEAMVFERTAQLEASRQELSHQASHDGLTGLLNRVAILAAFEQELARARRDDTSLTLVLADIDHFKVINDTYGHPAGDEALRRFSAALAAAMRPYDHAGRYGGEEFLLVLVGVEPSEIEGRISALHDCVSGLHIHHADATFMIQCSLGVAQVGSDHSLIDEKLVLVAADNALYEAKREGRNRFKIARLAREKHTALGASSGS